MRIYLKKEFCGEKEFVLVESGSMKASAFRYATGIEAVKVENTFVPFYLFTFENRFDRIESDKEELERYAMFVSEISEERGEDSN